MSFEELLVLNIDVKSVLDLKYANVIPKEQNIDKIIAINKYLFFFNFLTYFLFM